MVSVRLAVTFCAAMSVSYACITALSRGCDTKIFKNYQIYSLPSMHTLLCENLTTKFLSGIVNSAYKQHNS